MQIKHVKMINKIEKRKMTLLECTFANVDLRVIM